MKTKRETNSENSQGGTREDLEKDISNSNDLNESKKAMSAFGLVVSKAGFPFEDVKSENEEEMSSENIQRVTRETLEKNTSNSKDLNESQKAMSAFGLVVSKANFPFEEVSMKAERIKAGQGKLWKGIFPTRILSLRISRFRKRPPWH